MTKITNFTCVDDRGREVACDTYGNNVAFKCPKCKFPMLAVMRAHQRGADAEHPVVCRKCGHTAYFTMDEERERLVLQKA